MSHYYYVLPVSRVYCSSLLYDMSCNIRCRSDTTCSFIYTIISLIVLNVSFAVAPTVTLQQQLIGAPLGSVVSLDCAIESSPTALHFWSRGDGVVLHEVSKYLMQSSQSLASTSSSSPWPSYRTQVGPHHFVLN